MNTKGCTHFSFSLDTFNCSLFENLVQDLDLEIPVKLAEPSQQYVCGLLDSKEENSRTISLWNLNFFIISFKSWLQSENLRILYFREFFHLSFIFYLLNHFFYFSPRLATWWCDGRHLGRTMLLFTKSQTWRIEG